MSQLAWLTKSALPSSAREYVVTLPEDELWQADFFGAIVPLISSDNWEQHGALTPDEMADYWASVLLPQIGALKMAVPVGTVIAFAGPNVPLGYLICDGASLVRSEYQRLFDEIGVTFGSVDASHFNVPNLLGRFVLGDTAAHPVGQSGGAETHALTIAQLPAHNHNNGSSTLLSDGSQFDASGNVRPLVSTTGSRWPVGAIASQGSGQAHNNMPPYLSLFFIIKY